MTTDLSSAFPRTGYAAGGESASDSFFSPLPGTAWPGHVPPTRTQYADRSGRWRPPPKPVRFSETGLPVWEGLLVTALALLASFLLDHVGNGESIDQVDHALRTDLFITLVFYVLLGAATVAYVLTRRVHLVWSRDGGVAGALQVGIPTGLALGVVGVVVNSLLHHRLSGDPDSELLVGGGGVLRLSLALIVSAVLAPLVEETIFRGICAGSMLAKGPAPALLVSAGAFAVWHMLMPQLDYYALMGLMLGNVWRRRGLIASMVTHAAFNGVLVVAAIAATQSGGAFTSWQDLSFRLPGGWQQERASLHLAAYSGPAAAVLAITRDTPAVLPEVPELMDHLRGRESSNGMTVRAGTESVVSINGVDAAGADVTSMGQPGHVVMFTSGPSVYTVVMITSGSPKAEADWQTVLSSLHVQ